ncbi:MAG TPA: metalloregulator ArsR/SmtB family transcription factor [bacterium]|nr:metalloregulator ArsR/SmtB family transcription factor [bacterium]
MAMLPVNEVEDGERELEGLVQLFKAFADPARLRILNLLAHTDEVCSRHIEIVTGYGPSKVSRHLALLKQARLVQERREGLWVYCSLRPSTGAVRARLHRVLADLDKFYGMLAADAQRLSAVQLRPHTPDAEAGQPGSDHDRPSAAGGMGPLGTKRRVLFLCQSNAARSQMAEAWLRKYGGDQFEVFSAGLQQGEIHPFTRQVMAEVGLDLSGHRAKAVTEYLGKALFHYVITLCLEAEEECPRLFPGVGKILQWPFEDVANAALPDTEKLQKFRAVRDRIEQRVKEWLRD